MEEKKKKSGCSVGTLHRTDTTALNPRIFYYPGAQFDKALLVQAFVMIAVQAVLLKIALDNRPGPAHKGGGAALPFTGAQDGFRGQPRPYNFWQWRSHKP